MDNHAARTALAPSITTLQIPSANSNEYAGNPDVASDGADLEVLTRSLSKNITECSDTEQECTDRIDIILDQAEASRKQVEQSKDGIAARKLELRRRRHLLAEQRACLNEDKARALEAVVATTKKASLRLDRVRQKTLEARLLLFSLEDSIDHAITRATLATLDRMSSYESPASRSVEAESSLGEDDPRVTSRAEPESSSEERDEVSKLSELEDVGNEDTPKIGLESILTATITESDVCEEQKVMEKEQPDLGSSYVLLDISSEDLPAINTIEKYGKDSELSSCGFKSMGSSCDTWGMGEIDEDTVGARVRSDEIWGLESCDMTNGRIRKVVYADHGAVNMDNSITRGCKKVSGKVVIE